MHHQLQPGDLGHWCLWLLLFRELILTLMSLRTFILLFFLFSASGAHASLAESCLRQCALVQGLLSESDTTFNYYDANQGALLRSYPTRVQSCCNQEGHITRVQYGGGGEIVDRSWGHIANLYYLPAPDGFYPSEGTYTKEVDWRTNGMSPLAGMGRLAFLLQVGEKAVESIDEKEKLPCLLIEDNEVGFLYKVLFSSDEQQRIVKMIMEPIRSRELEFPVYMESRFSYSGEELLPSDSVFLQGYTSRSGFHKHIEIVHGSISCTNCGDDKAVLIADWSKGYEHWERGRGVAPSVRKQILNHLTAVTWKPVASRPAAKAQSGGGVSESLGQLRGFVTWGALKTLLIVSFALLSGFWFTGRIRRKA